MDSLFLFLSGLFLANGIPHFIHGIAGREFHSPSLHRVFPKVPSALFNTVWGLLNLALSLFLGTSVPKWEVGFQPPFLVFSAGFCFASVGLSLYFRRRSQLTGLNE